MNKTIKAITFSFDDGVKDDARVIEIMNRYGLKGTFNLNSGRLSNDTVWTFKGIKEVRHINYFDDPELYRGHEIACHSFRHPRLEELDKNTLDNEIRLDKKVLEYLYDCKVRGMAYPYGTYNEEVLEALRKNQIEYSRTIKNTYDFALPKEPLLWDPTCHFMDERIMELAEKFLASDEQQDSLFYIWGHSYELITEEEWKAFEELCKLISNREDICYCTNIEVLDFMKTTGRIII